VDLGVDSSTGTPGAGVPSRVTTIVAFLIDGFGEGEKAVDDGAGVGDEEL